MKNSNDKKELLERDEEKSAEEIYESNSSDVILELSKTELKNFEKNKDATGIDGLEVHVDESVDIDDMNVLEENTKFTKKVEKRALKELEEEIIKELEEENDKNN